MKYDSPPLISVLMPAYGCEKYIGEAIESIRNQTYGNWELLICDDASADRSYEIAQSYTNDTRITVHKNEFNKKKPLTVNELFTKSQGNIITVHDADDVSLPIRFEKIVELFQQQPDVYMCGHAIQRMTESGKPLPLFRMKAIDFNEIKIGMHEDNTDGDASLFVKRQVILELGQFFRPYFNNNEDYDFALRVIEKFKSTNLPDVLYYYRNVRASISKNVESYHKLVTQNVTKALARERQVYGVDALQKGDQKAISDLEDKFSLPYRLDKTLHFREMASFFMYCKMNKSAIRHMFLAVITEPMKFSNWRTLQYCLRKTIIGF